MNVQALYCARFLICRYCYVTYVVSISCFVSRCHYICVYAVGNKGICGLLRVCPRWRFPGCVDRLSKPLSFSYLFDSFLILLSHHILMVYCSYLVPFTKARTLRASVEQREGVYRKCNRALLKIPQ